MGFSVPSIKEGCVVPLIKAKIVEVIQLRPLCQMCQAPPQEQIVEQTVAFLMSEIKAKIVELCQVPPQERTHEHLVDPSFPRSAVVGSGKSVNLAVTLRRSCLQRHWHGHAITRMSSFRRCRKMRP